MPTRSLSPEFARKKVFEIAFDEMIIPLLAVGLAEMGDKTQLSIILLSSRTREYFRLLLGVMPAFLLSAGASSGFVNVL